MQSRAGDPSDAGSPLTPVVTGLDDLVWLCRRARAAARSRSIAKKGRCSSGWWFDPSSGRSRTCSAIGWTRGTLEDERIARPRTIERDVDGSLVVVSEFVPGSRLSDLLDTSAEPGTAPGVDVALGFLLDVLPALCGLHAGAGFAHGTISPSRTVLTPAGQIVLLDAIYGGALAHLRYSRRKLWTEFGVATPPRLPARRVDVETDIAQAALAAVMLVLGRPLAGRRISRRSPVVVGSGRRRADPRQRGISPTACSRFLHVRPAAESPPSYASRMMR